MKLDEQSHALKKSPRNIHLISTKIGIHAAQRVMLGGHPGLVAPPELELLSFENLKERRESFPAPIALLFLEGAIRAIMGIKDCDAEQGKQIMEAFEREKLVNPGILQYHFRPGSATDYLWIKHLHTLLIWMC